MEVIAKSRVQSSHSGIGLLDDVLRLYRRVRYPEGHGMHPRHGAARYHDPRIGRGEREQDAYSVQCRRDEPNGSGSATWRYIGSLVS